MSTALFCCALATSGIFVVVGAAPRERDCQALGSAVDSTAWAEEETKVHGLIQEGRYEEALTRARLLLREVSTACGDRSLETARVLDLIAEVSWRSGRAADEEGPNSARRAVETKVQRLGREHPAVASSLRNLGRLLESRGDYEEARSVLRDALVIQERSLGPRRIETAQTLDALADVLFNLGELHEAESLYQRALNITTSALGPQHPDNAEYLRNLGQVRRHAGDYEGAMGYLERGLDLAGNTLGREHPRIVWFLNSLAVLYEEMGDYTRARELYEKALRIAEKASPRDNARVLACLNNLGFLLAAMGDPDAAKAYFEEALDLAKRTQGERHLDVAMVLMNLGNLSRASGFYENAEEQYRRALEMHQAALGEEHVYVAISLDRLAQLSFDKGSYGEAKRLYHRELGILDKTTGASHVDYAHALRGLARVLEKEGDYAQARSLYRRALDIQERVFGGLHPEVSVTRLDLGRAHAGAGFLAEALEAALVAEEVATSHLRLLAKSLLEQEALRYARVRASGLDLALSLAAEARDPQVSWSVWDSLIRARALVLDEMATRLRVLRQSSDPEASGLVQALVRASTRVANLTLGLRGDESTRSRSLLVEALREKERVERALAAKSAMYRETQAHQSVGLQEVAARLPAGSVLVAFSQFDRYRVLNGGKSDDSTARTVALRTATSDGRAQEPAYLAFVLGTGQRLPAVLDLGSAEAIDELVSRWRSEITRLEEGRTSEPRDERACRIVGERLRRTLWDPLKGHLGKAERVFVVPDGTLNLVNFYALPVRDSSYLIETGIRIHYLSAERDLVSFSKSGTEGHGLLALGGAAFDHLVSPSSRPGGQTPSSGVRGVTGPRVDLEGRSREAPCPELKTFRFEHLPGTVRETEEVVALWRRGVSGRSAPRGTQTKTFSAEPEVVHLTGTLASETNFKLKAPGRKVLHLATHGFFLGGRCDAARAGGRGVGGLAVADDVRLHPWIRDNPLLLSGLALAGANRREETGPDAEDGLLTAEEIAALDLRSAQWVVLSACDTGVGEVLTGEGVLGLRRAFQIAGARALIMSLWAVEDEAAREWVEGLYAARYLDGRDTLEAVRQASVWILNQRRERYRDGHPFYWAAFVAAGDWR